MAVRKEFSLRIFSKDELRELEQDAVKTEDALRRIDNAQQKLRVRGALPKSFTRKQKRLEDLGLAGGRESDSLAAVSKAEEKIRNTDKHVGFLDSVLQKTGLKGKSKSLISDVGAPIQKANEFKNLKTDVDVLKKDVKAMEKLFGRATSLVQGAMYNPIGLTGQIGSLVSKIIPIGIAISIAQMAVQMWIDSYGKGGVNDPRKKILDDIKAFGIDIEQQTDIITGQTFFANTKTLKPRQDTISNTMNLRDGARRSRLLRLPYGSR